MLIWVFVLCAVFFILGDAQTRRYTLTVLFFIILLSLLGVPYPISAALGAVAYLSRTKGAGKRQGRGESNANA